MTYRSLLLQHQRERQQLLAKPAASAHAAASGPDEGVVVASTDPTTPLRRRRVPLTKIIPLPGGFGYINATYGPFSAPLKPSACGSEGSNDRTCGAPHAYDAIRYAATMEELVLPKVCVCGGTDGAGWGVTNGASGVGMGGCRGGGDGPASVTAVVSLLVLAAWVASLITH